MQKGAGGCRHQFTFLRPALLAFDANALQKWESSAQRAGRIPRSRTKQVMTNADLPIYTELGLGPSTRLWLCCWTFAKISGRWPACFGETHVPIAHGLWRQCAAS